MSAPPCAPGFDCTFQTSCPSFYIDCPSGYFCGSYEGQKHEKLMDYRYALYRSNNDDTVTVTSTNYEKYAPPNRTVQMECFIGLTCPNGTTIEVLL